MSLVYCQHIHLFCTDLDAMIAFWVKGFGMKFEEKRSFGGAPGAVLDMGLSAKLYLKQISCAPAGSDAPATGIDHLGFIVPDLDKAIADITALPAVTLSKEPFIAGPRRCCFVKGPDGVEVELMQNLPS